MKTDEQYEQYIALHRNFSEAYTTVYKHVMDFYPRPQQFMQEAEPVVNSFVEDFWTHKNNPPEDDSFRDLVFFAKNIKEFATNANDVFEEYKCLHGQSGNYIKAIFRLKEKSSAGNDEYAKLIPVLNSLITGFEEIKQKTNHAAVRLQKLQDDWAAIKTKINPGKAPNPP